MHLNESKAGLSYKIVKIHEDAIRKTLLPFGMKPGEEVKVMYKQVNGSVIVTHGRSTYTISSGVSHKVEIEELHD